MRTDTCKCHACGWIYFGDGWDKCPSCRSGIYHQEDIVENTPELIQRAHDNHLRLVVKGFERNLRDALEHATPEVQAAALKYIKGMKELTRV